jgi:anion-transporting  ArsA/GET3 family ATPase
MPGRGERRSGQPEPPETIEALFAAKEIVITCGSGGVGKTTTAAAAAAMAASRLGGKVLVVTVDPARRLATALGLEGFGNDEKPVPPEAFKSYGVRPRGELWAAMLDTKQSWDDLVRRHAPDRVTASRILANPLYQNISGKFIQSHDYIAMERLYELHSEGNFDLIVVDTPPTRNAIDFIEAPQRMAEFFSSRLLRLLIAPYRSRMINMASRPFYQVADRVLGSQFLEDIAEFFILFQTMYPGFVERARAVERLLKDRRTTFVVVSTLEAAPVREAEFFINVLTAKRFHLGALVLNKVLPDYLLDDAAEARAARLSDDSAELARSNGLADLVQTDEAQLTRVLAEVGENFRNFSVVARREAAQRHDLQARSDVVALVPEFDSDIHDLPGLLRLGERIWT